MGSLQQQQQRILIFDAWMQEAVEAKQLADEIESRIRDRDSALAAGTDRSQHVVTAARRKLLLLGTKLDRLESLIDNPPTKPILSERDLHSRKDMILDMRQQLKQLALSLRTLQSSKKTNLQDANANLQLDTEKAISPKNNGVNYFEDQNVQDKELESSKTTETDKKHTAIPVEEENNLQSPLLDSVDKDGNANQSSPQITMNGHILAPFGLFRSIRQGCLLAPTMYVLLDEGFGYLLAKAQSQGLVRGIVLPSSDNFELLNGHFTNDSFLTLIEDESNISNAMECHKTFCLASGSSIQWRKTCKFKQTRWSISKLSFDIGVTPLATLLMNCRSPPRRKAVPVDVLEVAVV
ncbi:hypothetical protein KI387_007216 [Taxus chinensis]|uniref:Uncharacterized protein n=1 Tax=Taxus chinensis TaxID=29808 RepID=A0AA38GRE9_TAXCH|nr:hypothetical protein KI387_007216 [Taxus chinensis]